MTARLSVRVTPNASRNEVKSVSSERVDIRLRAPAVEGKANAALVQFLADRLGLRPRAVTIERGSTARFKTVVVEGLDPGEARRRLAES